MAPKMGRPKIDNPKQVQVTARLDRETVEKLDKSASALGQTRAQTIRQGIEMVYEDVEKQRAESGQD